MDPIVVDVLDHCPVCCDSLTKPITTVCGHQFCLRCIGEVFERESRGRGGPCPMCRRPLSVFSLLDNPGGQPLVPAPERNPFGKTYVQSAGLGAASYHFDSPDDCYISYEHAPSSWLLADGSPAPDKKPFLSPTWDEETRTFCGRIEWSPSFNGSARWDCTIVFADDFASIASGRVDCEGGDTLVYDNIWSGGVIGLRYYRWLPPPATIFGCVYVQARAIFDPLPEGVASYHFESLQSCYISFPNAPDSWQLSDGSRMPDKKRFEGVEYDPESRTFQGTVSWDVPIDGDSTWDYTMVFSSDFSHIESGAVKCKNASGQVTTTDRFNQDLFYKRVPMRAACVTLRSLGLLD